MVVRKSAYAFLAAGISTGLLLLTGCGTTSSGPQNGLTPGGATIAYMIQEPQQGPTTLLEFPLTGPTATLTPTVLYPPDDNTGFNAIAVDSTGGIYVGAYDESTFAGEVLVYAPGSSGNATPVRTIYGDDGTSGTTFSIPQSMEINSSGTLAILSQLNSGFTVATLPATSTGTVTPTTLLQTNFYNPLCVSIGKSGVVYLSNYDGTAGEVYEYAAGATGNAAPITTVASATSVPYGLDADASGNLYTALDPALSTSPPASLGVFASGASGTATPTRNITGALAYLSFGIGLRADAVGNVYVVNNTANGTFNILAFPAGANGNVSPGLIVSAAELAFAGVGAEIAIH